MGDKIREMLTAIGAVAECTREMYRQLKRQGFTDDQALQLTKTWMSVTFRPQPQPLRRTMSNDYHINEGSAS